MAPPLNHLPSSSSLSTCHRHSRCSKAQMCFFNILHIISVFPAADVTEKKCFGPDEEICGNKAFGGDDVNVNLRLPTEVEPFETLAATADGYPENCVKATSDRRKTGSFAAEESELAVEEEEEEERATEHSEISHVGDQSSGGIDYNGVDEEEEKQRDEGYLGLLIEAAQLIIGEESRNPSEPPARKHVEASSATTARRGVAKRKQQCWTAATEAEWYAEFEDTSPVVKSKRGRSQVLPYKYRDSVVEPLVGWTSSATHHRSIANSAAVPSKRRSK